MNGVLWVLRSGAHWHDLPERYGKYKRPVDFAVTAGQIHDCTQAINLLAKRKPEVVLADKGYDSNAIVQHISGMGGIAVIPPKRNRKQHRECDKALYKQRSRIEHCFSGLKHFRRFATRYEKLKTNLKALVALACAWLPPSAICRYCLV